MSKRLYTFATIAAALTWNERLRERRGDDAIGQSKHQRARTPPCGHKRALRKAHKRQRQARKAQRGK